MPLIERGAVDLAFCREDLVEAANRLDCQWHLPQIGQDKELAPTVSPARCFRNRPWTSLGLVQFAEPGIGVGLQGSGPAGEVPARVLAAAVARVEKHGRRGIGAAKRAVIPDVSPKPPRHGLVFG